jgi:hypothetical protein
MAIDKTLEFAFRMRFDLNTDLIPDSSNKKLLRDIKSLLWEAGARPIDRTPPEGEDPNSPPAFSARGFLVAKPAKIYRRQNEMTATLRPLMSSAFRINVAGLDYASVSEYGPWPDGPGERVQMYRMWREDVYKPHHFVTDELIENAIKREAEVIERMLDMCGLNFDYTLHLSDPVPHNWKWKRYHWAVRKIGKFLDGPFGELPPSSVGIRCDGLEDIVRFISTDTFFEAISDGRWLLVGRGQLVLVVRTGESLSDNKPGMKSRTICDMIRRCTGEPLDKMTPADEEAAVLAAQFAAARAKMGR